MPRTPMPLPLRLTYAAILATLALAVTACEPPLAPRPEVNGSGEPSLTQGLVYPNAIRYSDAGHKPATGRSGSARLTVRALHSVDGTTELEITTGTLDSPMPAPGNLDKIQVRVFDEENQLSYVRNFNGLRSGGYLSYKDLYLPHKWRVQVQANVSGIDPRRIDVVTVTETVRLRPDLAALELHAPAKVPVNAVFNVNAVVAEKNGEVGAGANCVLYDGDQAVDRANGIWVDAGSVVSCAFTHRFETVGLRTVTVRVEDVLPRDDDPTNNSASAEIEVVGGNSFHYNASASDVTTITTTTLVNHQWTSDSSSGSEKKTTQTNFNRSQLARLSAWKPGAVTFPIARVAVHLSTDGKELHTKTFDNLTADRTLTGSTSGSTCAMRNDLAVMTLQVCAEWKTVSGVTTHTTTVLYTRSAGQATFRSTSYTRFWSNTSGDYYVYHPEQNSGSSSGTMLTYGAELTIGATVEDDGQRYATAPSMALSRTEKTTIVPLTCNGVFQTSTGFARNCTGRETYTNTVSGQKVGTPD